MLTSAVRQYARAGTSTKKSEWLVCVVVRTEDFLLEISLEKQDLSSATQTPRTWAQEAFKASHQTYIPYKNQSSPALMR